MTTTLRAIRRKMLALVPDLGRVAPVTALAAQSATAARLGGGVSAQKWVNYWMLRSEAATAADRNQRYASSYNGASGAFTHNGVPETPLCTSGRRPPTPCTIGVKPSPSMGCHWKTMKEFLVHKVAGVLFVGQKG